MLNKMCLVMGCFLLFPFLAVGFDCNKPDFGVDIDTLNRKGDFVKYMEKGGISYYNYTGPCRMDVHERANPAISYAFVQDRLYARLIRIPGENGDPQEVRKRLEARVRKQIGPAELEMKQDGDWYVYQWFNEKESLKFKVKIHNLTHERKSAFYYEPLRVQLQRIMGVEDPVQLDD